MIRIKMLLVILTLTVSTFANAVDFVVQHSGTTLVAFSRLKARPWVLCAIDEYIRAHALARYRGQSLKIMGPARVPSESLPNVLVFDSFFDYLLYVRCLR
jgi:hypothetical protein